MRNFGNVANTAVFTFLVIAPFTAAESAKSGGTAQCTTVRFPDAFGFGRCINENMNLCNISQTDVQAATHKLARCFAKSPATPAIAFMVLNGVRETILMALQLASPNAAHFLFPLLKLIEESIQQETLQERSYPQTFCYQQIAVNFTNVPRIGECARPIRLLCQRFHQLHDGQVSTLLLSTMVCVFKKFPQFDMNSLIKEVICMGLELITRALQRRRHFYPMVTGFELAQLLLKCNVYEVVNSKAERRLLDELSA